MVKQDKAAWIDAQNGILLHDPAPYPGVLAFEANLNILLNAGQTAAIYLKTLQGLEGDLKFTYELLEEEDGWLRVGVAGFTVLGCDPARAHISRFMRALDQAKACSEALAAGSFMEEIAPFLIVSRQGLPRGPFVNFFYQQAINFLAYFVIWPRFRGNPAAAWGYAAALNDGTDPLGLLDQEPLIASLIANAGPDDRAKIFAILSKTTASALQAKSEMMEKAWASFDVPSPPG